MGKLTMAGVRIEAKDIQAKDECRLTMRSPDRAPMTMISSGPSDERRNSWHHTIFTDTGGVQPELPACHRGPAEGLLTAAELP